MKVESIDIEATIEKTKRLLEEDQSISPSLKTSIELFPIPIDSILLNMKTRHFASWKIKGSRLPTIVEKMISG
jgi:hypothetical protein